jgi:ferredoxin--NADP+ reductase
MFKIIKKVILNSQITSMDIDAPLIAEKALPGQFIILRVCEDGERIPLTIADYDRNNGTIRIIFQIIGKTTQLLNKLKEGDSILDVVGPLGLASHFENIKTVAVVGGGLGTAIAYPQAKKLHSTGVFVDIIAGFRNKDLIILENDLKSVSDNLFITTDDGSNGMKGFVTDILKSQIESTKKYDLVIAIGPLVMMKAVCALTKQYNIKTIVSMNPVMIDGTGMCGGCRVTVGGKIKFACVDGPDFDGHQIDFDEAIRRSRMYQNHEKTAVEKHICNLGGQDLNA